jgi:HYR domain
MGEGRTTIAILGALAVGLAVATSASAGSLELNATLNMSRTPGTAADCAPGAPDTALCARYSGEASIRGLGAVTSRYTKMITSMTGAGCEVSIPTPAVIEVASKGTIELSTDACWLFRLPISIGPFQFTVGGGTGSYAGATGVLTFTSQVAATPPGARDLWTGTLTVPGYEFDLTPPTFTGARNRVVKVAKKAKRVRVRYSVKATDAVDGPLAATCAPRSGSMFRLGRKRVTCSAEDSSANSATKSFIVTVKRRR